MEKIKIKIIGFYQPYPHDSSCLVVFKEENGKRKLILRIGLSESESILMALEKIKPGRPVIHDLFYNLAQTINMTMKEMIIYRYAEGIFYSKVIFHMNDHEIETPARSCDALALALRFHAPVFVNENILAKITNEKEVLMADMQNKASEKALPARDLGKIDNESLKKLLKESIDKEDYELAGLIRDEMVKRNKPSNES
jgi:bifunctional DNase/RNase